MHPRISVNMASSMGWTLDQDIAFYASRGIKAATVLPSKLGEPASDGIRAVRDAGLGVAAMVWTPAPGGSLIDETNPAVQMLMPAVETAGALGSPCLYVLAGSAPPRMPTDQAYDRLVGALRPASAHARDLGLRLALEANSHPTRASGFIHTLADAAELSRDADMGICLELQNCWYERHLPHLFRENVGRIDLVQVNDFLVGEELRLNRRVPGDGSMPLEWMLGHLLEAGYPGYFDLEIVGPAIEREGYASAIDRSLDWLGSRLLSWGV